jgi:hypothetical protein
MAVHPPSLGLPSFLLANAAAVLIRHHPCFNQRNMPSYPPSLTHKHANSDSPQPSPPPTALFHTLPPTPTVLPVMQLTCQHRDCIALRCQYPVGPVIFLPRHRHPGSRFAVTTLLHALSTPSAACSSNAHSRTEISLVTLHPSVPYCWCLLLVRPAHVPCSTAVDGA